MLQEYKQIALDRW